MMSKDEVEHLSQASIAEPHYFNVDESGRRLSVTGRRVSTVDDVFGEIVEGGPNYRNVCIQSTIRCRRSAKILY